MLAKMSLWRWETMQYWCCRWNFFDLIENFWRVARWVRAPWHACVRIELLMFVILRSLMGTFCATDHVFLFRCQCYLDPLVYLCPIHTFILANEYAGCAYKIRRTVLAKKASGRDDAWGSAKIHYSHFFCEPTFSSVLFLASLKETFSVLSWTPPSNLTVIETRGNRLKTTSTTKGWPRA